jgi:hypothetical protein
MLPILTGGLWKAVDDCAVAQGCAAAATSRFCLESVVDLRCVVVAAPGLKL